VLRLSNQFLRLLSVSVQAMGQLAAGYRDGSDVPKDLDLATQWFERAADFTVEAMYQSYLMYSQEMST